MSKLVPFSFDNHPVRAATDDQGTPWFVAKDVAEILGYDQTANGLKHCKGASVLDELNKNNGLAPATKWIQEADVYRMVMRSTLPDAERFQDWVVEEVLPSIRKTGSYSVQDAKPAKASPRPREIREAYASFRAIGKLIGLKGNMLELSANQATQTWTGVNPLALLGHAALEAETQEVLLTATDVGNRLGHNDRGKTANRRLTEAGLQTNHRDLHNHLYYELTPLGEAFGMYQDTSKAKGSGTPIRQIKWKASVVEFLIAQTPVSEDAA